MERLERLTSVSPLANPPLGGSVIKLGAVGETDNGLSNALVTFLFLSSTGFTPYRPYYMSWAKRQIN